MRNYVNKIVLSLSLGFITISALAQAPGYIGKTNAIGVKYMMSADINGYTNTAAKNGYDISEKNRAFTGFGIEYEKITSKSSSIVLAVAQRTIKYSYFSEDYFGNSYYSDIPPLAGIVMLNQTSIDLGFRTYGRGVIAPMGAYTQFDFTFANTKLNYDDLKGKIVYELYDYATNTTEQGTIEQEADLKLTNGSIKSFGFGMTLGKQFILSESLLLDYSIKVNCLLPGINLVKPYNTVSIDDSYIEKRTYFESYSNNASFNGNLIWFSIALKFMK